MKKETIILAICFSFLLASPVSAISDDAKSLYSPGETMIIKLSGNILEPIKTEQVEFYRSNVLISREYDVKKIGDNYYIWAISPLDENNYTFLIKEIVTTIAGKTSKLNYEKNFSVSGNLTDYSINPGFIYTDKDFSITARLNEDENKAISLNFPEKVNYLLKPGDNEIKFSIADVTGENFTLIQIGKYSVPAYIKGHEPITYAPSCLFNPRRIEKVILISDNIALPISIINTGNWKADELIITYNRDVFLLDNNKYTDILPGQSVDFDLKFNKDFISSIDESTLIENISATYGNNSIYIPVEINFTKNQTKINNIATYNPNDLLLCLELNGTKCSSGSKCSMAQIASKDGLCCKGQCVKQGGTSSNFWLGFGILVLIIAIIAVFMLKYKKAGIVKNPIQKFAKQ